MCVHRSQATMTDMLKQQTRLRDCCREWRRAALECRRKLQRSEETNLSLLQGMCAPLCPRPSSCSDKGQG